MYQKTITLNFELEAHFFFFFALYKAEALQGLIRPQRIEGTEIFFESVILLLKISEVQKRAGLPGYGLTTPFEDCAGVRGVFKFRTQVLYSSLARAGIDPFCSKVR